MYVDFMDIVQEVLSGDAENGVNFAYAIAYALCVAASRGDVEAARLVFEFAASGWARDSSANCEGGGYFD